MGAPTRPAKPKRATRGQVRTWAWIVGSLSVLTPWAMFGVSPRPVAGATALPSRARHTTRPIVVIVTRKIIHDGSTSASTSGGPITYVTAAAPSAPTAISCGTHPC